MNSAHDKKVYEALKSLNVIPEEKLKMAFAASESSEISFYEALVDKDLITDDNYGTIAADIYGVPYADLSRIVISQETLRIIPEVVARKKKVIAYYQDDKGIRVAMLDPDNKELIDFISKKVGEPVIPHYSTKGRIEDALTHYNKDLESSFEDLMKQEIQTADKASDSSAPVSKIVDMLIKYAYQNKASDIHIEPEEEISVVRFRVDGVLHDVLNYPKRLHEQIVSRIKIMSGLRTDEHMSAQDGRTQVNIELEELDIRVSIVPIVDGEKCVLRLLSSKSRRFSLHDLGVGETELEKIKKGYESPHGMVLSTGPTGSGKTTSIYAILKILNSRQVNIATIEDPVEYDIAGINQIQVNNATNLTFAHGLKAILRQDPDIIFVGEIRDEETADIAVNSAMTGHLVLSTLHTNDAATTLPRLMDMGIEPYLVASTVNVIIAQRLVRRICDLCKTSYTVPKTDLSKLFSSEEVEKYFGKSENITMYKGRGCELCHGSGYIGRIGIFEVLPITPAIRDLIAEKSTASKIQNKAREEGMRTMYEDGLEKVSKGLTTLDELFRVTKE